MDGDDDNNNDVINQKGDGCYATSFCLSFIYLCTFAMCMDQ